MAIIKKYNKRTKTFSYDFESVIFPIVINIYRSGEKIGQGRPCLIKEQWQSSIMEMPSNLDQMVRVNLSEPTSSEAEAVDENKEPEKLILKYSQMVNADDNVIARKKLEKLISMVIRVSITDPETQEIKASIVMKYKDLESFRKSLLSSIKGHSDSTMMRDVTSCLDSIFTKSIQKKEGKSLEESGMAEAVSSFVSPFNRYMISYSPYFDMVFDPESETPWRWSP